MTLLLLLMGECALQGDTSAVQASDVAELRGFLRRQCGLPTDRVPLSPRTVGKVAGDGYALEKLVYDSEPCSSVPAHLYLPRPRMRRVPVVVIAHGHGGSKSTFASQYAGQLYARAGFAVLATDPLGEEERDPEGGWARAPMTASRRRRRRSGGRWWGRWFGT